MGGLSRAIVSEGTTCPFFIRSSPTERDVKLVLSSPQALIGPLNPDKFFRIPASVRVGCHGSLPELG